MTETRVQEALRLARAAKAARTPEQVAFAEAVETRLLSRFFRLMAGTEDMTKSKGHVPCIVPPVAEFREFRKTSPATHMWAEFEEKFLDLGDL